MALPKVKGMDKATAQGQAMINTAVNTFIALFASYEVAGSGYFPCTYDVIFYACKEVIFYAPKTGA